MRCGQQPHLATAKVFKCSLRRVRLGRVAALVSMGALHRTAALSCVTLHTAAVVGCTLQEGLHFKHS